MEELRDRFGRALRDQNFWSLMEELEGQAPPEEIPTTVVAFPSERIEESSELPSQPGKIITGRFPKKP